MLYCDPASKHGLLLRVLLSAGSTSITVSIVHIKQCAKRLESIFKIRTLWKQFTKKQLKPSVTAQDLKLISRQVV